MSLQNIFEKIVDDTALADYWLALNGDPQMFITNAEDVAAGLLSSDAMQRIKAYLKHTSHPTVWGSDVDGYRAAHRARLVERLGEEIAEWVMS